MPDAGQQANKMMIDVHMIRSTLLLGLLCLCAAGELTAAPPVHEPVLADGGRSEVLRLPESLSEVPVHRLSLERAPAGARLGRDGAGGHILRWPVTPELGAESEVVLTWVVGEDAGTPERIRLRVRRGARAPAASPPTVPRAVRARSRADEARVDGRAEWRPGPVRSPGLGAARPDTAAHIGAARAAPSLELGNVAPELGRIGPQRLVVGRPWQLHVRVRDADGDEPVFFTAGLPEAATFGRGRDGWLVLGWTPTAEAIGRMDVTLGAADGRDRRLRTERVVRLDVVAPGDAAVPAGEAPAMPPASAPVIEPLAAQVVSTGRAVSFRVLARLEDGHRPHILIDRLPARAGFYENLDGSRTFHWPTESRDQGEHLFRITAVHPNDDALRSRAEMLVIVGNPTFGRTTPDDPTGRIAAAIAPPRHAPTAEVYRADSSEVYRDGPYPDEDPAYPDEFDRDGFGYATSYDYDEPDYDDPRYEELGYDEFGYDRSGRYGEFDYTEEAPAAAYAYPDDGREYFLGEDGVAVDADGNPVGDFRFDAPR